MKKVLAIVLALAMILGSFSFVAADTATNSDVAGTKYEGAVAVLGALGVVSGYPDGTFKPEKVVTRAEMCKLVINALGLDEYVAGSYAGYPDVAGSHWATSYIAYATSLGVITGYPDGTFRPENPVTYQEAAAMLVRALGYQDKYLIGSWPASHVNVAVSEGLLKGVKATAEGATRGDIALMFFNALPVKMVKYDKWEQVGETNDTMLTRMDAKVAKEQIFDQKLAHAALVQFGIDMSDYVGAKVDYYWIDAAPAETADGNNPILPDTTAKDAPIAIAKEYSTFLTGEYKENDGDHGTFVVGDTTYKFDADNLMSSADETFYNGSTTINANIINGGIYTIAAKLNGVYIEDVYTVSQWQAYEELQWTEDDAETLAADKKIASVGFEMTKTDAIDYSWLTLAGVEDLATIAKDSIVTVYVDNVTFDQDGTIASVAETAKITKIGVSTDVVTGKITKVAGPNGKEVYTIGDKALKASKLASAPTLGAEGTFFLNYKGEIAAAKADSYAANYAIILDAAAQKNTYGSAGVWQLYLMTKDGEKAVYDFKDAATFEKIEAGEGQQGQPGYVAPVDLTDADNEPAETSVIGKLISFKTNADGKIVAVSDVATSSASTLTDKGIMNGYLIADDVVVFDTKAELTKDWGLGSVANLNTTITYTDGHVLYALNAKGKISAIVIDNAAATKSVSNLGFFTGNYSTYNAKNEEIYGGTMLQNGAVVDFTTVAKVDGTGLANVADTDALYKLTYKGADISKAEAALYYFSTVGQNKVAGSTAPLKEASFTGTAFVDNDATAQNAEAANADYTFYNDDAKTDGAFAIGQNPIGIFTDLYKVLQKADGTVDLGKVDGNDQIEGDQAAPNYQYIGAATNVYKMTIKQNADGSYSFDKLAVGSASDVKKGAYVMLFQLDKKSGAWDTIVYLTAADATKLTPQ